MLKPVALVALALALEGAFILHTVVSFTTVPATREVRAAVEVASAGERPEGVVARPALARLQE